MIEVYKYGGNLLKFEDNRQIIYNFLKKKIEKGIKVIMVVSAWGRETDSFSTDSLAKNIEYLDNKDKDQIMTFGEIYSTFLIKNELLKRNFKVNSISYKQIGIQCDNNYQDGNVLQVDMKYMESQLNNNDILIVPGFIGESKEGNIISLGRNTSDLTAVIIGNYFKVKKINIIKEVNGIYKIDPKKEENPFIIKRLSYDQMLSLIDAGSEIFSKKTIIYAKEKAMVIDIKDLFNEEGSIISELESDQSILFINEKEEENKIVFKDMNSILEFFKQIVSKKITLKDIIIEKNIGYFKGSEKEVRDIINNYL